MSNAQLTVPNSTDYISQEKKNIENGPKKASVFIEEEMTKFLMEAPDETFLIHKVTFIRRLRSL